MLHLAGQDSRGLARKAGISLDDARRITGAVIGRGGSLREARNVRREVLDRVAAQTTPGELTRIEAVDAQDGFRKYLLALPDGARIEAVRIPLYDTHHVVCVSSQAGCALGCTFCATGELGLTRSLRSWEIVAQVLHVRADSTRPVTGVVFMGQGEPFLNYDAVLEAAYALCDPAGGRIDARRISISTAGVVPMIRRYTAEGHKFRLCVSLTAAIPWKRRALMPVEQGFPLDELVDAIREHAAVRGRVTLEYVMIAGVNVGPEDAAALGQLLSGIPVRLNPISVNDVTGRFRPPTEAEWNLFRDALARELPGQPIVRRYSGGQDEHAACGMLASRARER
ncbi:radical SAM protein [Anaeromyxobacter oryzae]|uniref:Dual-specificity RNA methyltransferase RlmN n=1 Tax=Anaeromyxobacter oryzae TaxID=2918170 RepID=A0ABM7WV46_9BACT|nr:radical SAM protein [Anaeromyxobacter oryzae]BDG03362.1 putative dual-specificity RNA methyltransferase RlmN [Anaeromyxobacter oryzae]